VLLHLSRDSVAAGDDVESHDQDVEVDERRNLATFIQMTVRDGYLPIISGGKATWVALSGRRGKWLAVVAAQWKQPQLIVDFGTEVGAIGDSLHFRYLTQRDPQELLDEVRAAHAQENPDRPYLPSGAPGQASTADCIAAR
jgi:hypothetical protein